MPRYRSIPDQPSRSQVKKAARTLRKWWVSPIGGAVPDEVAIAWMIVSNYRAGFQKPLDKVTIQLRRFVGYEVDDVIVAQRLKRMPTIVNKLARQPTMDLTRMQDIGGCRAVLPDAATVDAVLGRIATHWRVERPYDYVTKPKPSGYRALHVAVVRDERLIEIQLRTPGQQAWAEAVERAGVRLRASVKDGIGPEPVLRYFHLLGRVIALDEAGEPVDDETVAEIEGLEEQVRAVMGRNRERGRAVPLIHFLLVYDLDRQSLVGDPREFSDPGEAASAYAELEEEHRGDSSLEIVLIGADSLDTIKSTHGNYFDESDVSKSRFFEAVG